MGAWIETRELAICRESHQVAPYMGAWIETLQTLPKHSVDKSHPTWVRGLKQDTVEVGTSSKPSHPTWVRGLKLLMMNGNLSLLGRTLHGCVD